MAVAPNDSYEIRASGLDWTLERIVRRDHDLIATTPDHIDVLIEDAVNREGRAERRRQLREYYLEVPVPETHPAFDPEGQVLGMNSGDSSIHPENGNRSFHLVICD